MKEMYMKALIGLGMVITEEHKTVLGADVFEAQIETSRGVITVICGSNGTARIDKPNGTHKWYCEKTSGQLRSAVKQTIDFWK